MSDRKRNYQHGWTGGPNVQPGHAERAKKNKDLMESPQFKTACDNAGIPVSRRQASKYRNKRGRAYKVAIKVLS